MNFINLSEALSSQHSAFSQKTILHIKSAYARLKEIFTAEGAESRRGSQRKSTDYLLPSAILAL
jgi:hypothetical protein